MVSKQDIFALMQECGIAPSDKVTVHCSLRAIGPLENGADGLIDGMKDYLCEGLLLVPTHTWANVDGEHPYDVRTTEPCIGALAKVAASRPDGFRSLHPTHSMAGFGRGAREYLAGEEKLASPGPVGSALSRLYEEKGWVLLIGVDHARNTYLHTVDERLKLPNRINPKPYIMSITDHAGNTFPSPPYHGHYTPGVPSCSDFYPNYKDALDCAGAVTYHRLGNALVYCCHVRKMTDAVAALWEKTDHDLCIREEPVPEEYYK